MNDYSRSFRQDSGIAFGMTEPNPTFRLMPEKEPEPNNLCLIKSRQNLSNLGQFQTLKSSQQ